MEFNSGFKGLIDGKQFCIIKTAPNKNDDINKFLVFDGKRMCEMAERRDVKDKDTKEMISQ